MNVPQRYIAHFDLDSFFVSVEIVNNPTLKGKPVLVGGHSERGVVTAASYEARKFGVYSAMPMRKAMQLCPQAIVVKGTRGEYSRYSRMVTDIIAAKAPLFEKASIDEFYIDLTGMDKYFDPYKWTIELREEIIEKTGLPISFALATNKLVSKIATNEAKPNGFMQLPAGFEKEFLAPLAVNKIPGVGDHTYETIKQLGIRTIGEAQQFGLKELERRLGRFGNELWNRANGIDDSPVSTYHEAKSISTENTFEADTKDQAFLLSELVRMTEKIGYELRQDKKLAGCVAVKIKYSNFNVVSKQAKIDYTMRDDELMPVVKDLFQKLYNTSMAIRLLGVRLSELTSNRVQGSLFDNEGKKNELYKAIDDVKNKYGKSAVKKARTI